MRMFVCVCRDVADGEKSESGSWGYENWGGFGVGMSLTK